MDKSKSQTGHADQENVDKGSGGISSLRSAMQSLHSSSNNLQVHTRVKRLDKATKAYIDGMLRRAEHRAWCLTHGKTLPPPRLHPVILRVIREWFDLVDDDGSGTLEHHELLGALQAARIPCDAASISEMIKLMDANRDGCIGWGEFECFMMDEFAAGKHLLSGEYVLPSGMALPFGVMIRQLKRTQMLSEITQGGDARRKWLHYDINLSADAKAVAEAEEAIRTQKAFNETLHNREVVEHDAQHLPNMEAEEPPGSFNHSSSSISSSANHLDSMRVGSSSCTASEDVLAMQAFNGIRRPSWMVAAKDVSGHGELAGEAAAAVAAAAVVVQSAAAARRHSSGTGSAATAAAAAHSTPRLSAAAAAAAAAVSPVGVTVVAGVPVVTPRALTPSGHQQHQQHQRHQQAANDSANAATGAAGAAGGAGGAGVAAARASRATMKPAAVPRLQLAAISGDGSNSRASSSRTMSGLRLQQQQQQQGQGESADVDAACGLLGIEPGSVLASARGSYWLGAQTPTAPAGGAAAAAAGQPKPAHRDSVADHLFQQNQLQRQLLSPRPAGSPAAGSGRCSPAAVPCSACCSPGRVGCAGSSAVGQSQSPTTQRQCERANSPRHVLQPQPCRDEWSVMAASSIARQYSSRCGTPRIVPRALSAGGSGAGAGAGRGGCCAAGNNSSSSRDMSSSTVRPGCARRSTFTGSTRGSSNGGNGAGQQAAAARQLQQQQGKAQAAAALPAAVLQAALAAQQLEGSYRDVCVKHLLSARPTPPAALLSQTYIGPVTAAVAAAHTPRSSTAGAVAAVASVQSAGPWGAGAAVQQQRQKQQQQQLGTNQRHGSPRSAGMTGGVAAAAEGAAAAAAGAAATPRSALRVATNHGGALVTEQGKVMKYIETPRVNGSSSSSKPPAAAAAAAAARESMSNDSFIAAAVASGGIGSNNSNSSGSHGQLSHRNSVLAQQLVRSRASYNGDSLAGSASSGGGKAGACAQQQQQGTSLQVCDGSSSSTGSCARKSTHSFKLSLKGSLQHSALEGKAGAAAREQQASMPVTAAAANEAPGTAAGSEPKSFKQCRQASYSMHYGHNRDVQLQNSGITSTASSSCGISCRGVPVDKRSIPAGLGTNRSSAAGSTVTTAGAGQDGSQHSNSRQRKSSAAAAAAKRERHYAASGPLGGHHPAYTNSYNPPAAAAAGQPTSSASGRFVGAAQLSDGGAKKALLSSPRLSYSGLSPRGRKA